MSNFNLYTRFQSISKKIPMEIMGEEIVDGKRIFLVAELSRLFEENYEGMKVSEEDLELKLTRAFICIIK